jgi:hypothetical protein
VDGEGGERQVSQLTGGVLTGTAVSGRVRQWGVRVWTLASLGEGEGGVEAIGRSGSQVGSSVGRSVAQDFPIARGFLLENRDTDSSRLCGE